jgi:hypothetical protein
VAVTAGDDALAVRAESEPTAVAGTGEFGHGLPGR